MAASPEVAQRFGRNLARTRERAGYSQEDLSFMASIHRTHVGYLERGERLARVDTLVKLAASLEIAPEDLLAGIEWKPVLSPVLGRFEFPDSDASL